MIYKINEYVIKEEQRMSSLQITIVKEDNNVHIDYQEGSDIHEVIGVLGTMHNHLMLTAQGIDFGKLKD